MNFLFGSKNDCLSTLSGRFSASTGSAVSRARRILASWLNPGHLDIKMFVQDTGREFPLLELTFRKFNCWISHNGVGSKYSTLKEQMGGSGPGIPTVFAGAAPPQPPLSFICQS